SKVAGAEATRLAQRARTLAPKDPDLAWLVAHSLLAIGPYLGTTGDALAFIDSVAPRVGNPSELLTVRASALYSQAYPTTPSLATANQGPDTAKVAAAMRAYDAARAADSASYNAVFEQAVRLRTTDEARSLGLMKLAITLSPRATVARTVYWGMVLGQRGV